MSRSSPRRCLLAASFLILIASTVAHGQVSFENSLEQGKLADAEKTLADTLKAKPDDDEARFGLGVVQFLRAVEGRMQAFYRHGFRTEPAGFTPLSNLPIPHNPKPEPLDYRGAREVLQVWIDDLARSEATLAKVKSPGVKLPLHFGLIRLDFNGDGKADEDETLWKIYSKFNPQGGASAEAAKGFVIAFDRGDVDWLRGYCHVLSAMAEALLAHDFEVILNSSGFLLFDGIKAPEPFQGAGKPAEDAGFGTILDYVAMVHLIRLPVAEPERLKSFLTHFEAMVTLSRSSWKFIVAETDNDREWLPNPKQASVIPNVRVTPEMVQGWTDFLNEFELVLQGKKLVPFWRGAKQPKLGINFRRVLSEPRPFDFVLWIQGSAAVPYLEAGEISTPETWARFDRIFQGEFIGFALWFN